MADLTGKLVELLGTSTSTGVTENGVSTFDVLAQTNDKIVGVTPAMPSGCSMNILMKAMPERVPLIQ